MIKWSKKMTFYLIQMAMQNAYALYMKYTTDTKKLTHLQFQMMAIEALVYFDVDEWPVQGPPIRRPGPIIATPGSPGTATSPPASPRPSSDTDVDPAPPVEKPKRRPRYVDPPERLTTSLRHHPVPVGHKVGMQKRCRVCLLNKKRKDTTKMCGICKVPLCVRENCFEVYHTQRRYWVSPRAATGVSGSSQH